MFGIFKNKQFLQATAVLVGTMVGVGIFGIPFSFAKAGFWIGFSFLIGIGFITLFLDYIYGEIILRTHQSHQLVGYTQFYLGGIWKRVMFFSILLTTYSALLAYIIIAGDFLANVLSPISYINASNFSFWFFVVASSLVFMGMRTIAWVELGIACLFIIISILIFIFGIGKVNFSNFSTINPELWFVPYGVILFAFGGLPAIPIQRRILGEQEKLLRYSILTAMIFVLFLYLLFSFTVFGVSGDATSPDAISGLVEYLGGKIVFLGSLFGVLAVSTSYIMLGTGLLQIFNLDYGFSRKLSWLMVIAPPFALFLGGLRNFIDVIGLAGGVAVGLEALVLIWVFVKAKTHGDRLPEYSMTVPAWFLYLIATVFIIGMVYTFIIR